MEYSKPFYDLCVYERCCNNFVQFASKCIEFGYKTIAINQEIDSSNPVESKKKNKKGDNKVADIVPLPIRINPNEKHNIRVFNRLTIVLNDKNFMYKIMHSENFQKYHIIAVVPKTRETMQLACELLDIDIISFDPSDSKSPKINRKLYEKAVNRHIYFEISYFPAIIDQSLRRNIINRSHDYHQTGKSKNIIITSGCNSVLTLRGPYDVINLGLIFGLSEEQSKYCISSACADVINQAMGRRIGKAGILIKSNLAAVSDNEEEMEVDVDEPVQKKIKVNRSNLIIIKTS